MSKKSMNRIRHANARSSEWFTTATCGDCEGQGSVNYPIACRACNGYGRIGYNVSSRVSRKEWLNTPVADLIAIGLARVCEPSNA